MSTTVVIDPQDIVRGMRLLVTEEIGSFTDSVTVKKVERSPGRTRIHVWSDGEYGYTIHFERFKGKIEKVREGADVV